jgi:hypothetical protein
MTPKIRAYSIVIAALLMTGGSRATASIQFHLGDVVHATLDSATSFMGTGATSLALYDSSNHLQETWNSSQGGLLGWTNVTVNGLAAPNFNTSCIEVLQNVSWGSPAQWTIVDLATAPKPNPLNGLTALSGMGTAVANLIETLYNTHYADAETSHTDAGAYQIAIWKLVYDGAGVVSGPDFTTGRLQANDTAEVELADLWLKGLTGTFHSDVVGLSSDSFQDQVYGGNAAPEPASLAVWSIVAVSAAGMILIGRRQAKA